MQEITMDSAKNDPFLGLLSNEVISKAAGDVSSQDLGRSFYRLAKLHYDKADLPAAEKYFHKALEYAQYPRDSFATLKTYGFLIRMASEELDQTKANSLIARAEQIIDRLSQDLGSLNAEYFYHLGLVKNYRSSFAEAKENLQLAIRKSREENDPELTAKCLLSLASNALILKDHRAALDFVEQLQEILFIINKKYLIGAMAHLRARIYSETGELELAIRFFTEANKSLVEKACWNLYGYVLLGQGAVWKKKGAFQVALQYFELAKQSVDPSNFKRLHQLIEAEIKDVNDSSVDLYLDRSNRKIIERGLGTIDFKHRFVLLEILFLLAKNSGEYYDKEALARQIWKDEYNPLIHDKLIYTSVSRLRKLIEPKVQGGSKRKYIIRGKDGYTFNPDARIRFHIEHREPMENSIGNVEVGSPV